MPIDTESKIKIKPMSPSEMYLAADRLTRFKSPDEKYNRVFREIISKYLITPKISYKLYETIDAKEISDIVENIFMASLAEVSANQFPCELHKKVVELERLLYVTDEKTKILMETKIPYEGVIAVSADAIKMETHSPQPAKNMQFLTHLLNNHKIPPKLLRKRFETRFPVEKVVLAEGITEEILLPMFSNIVGYNFDAEGIEVVAAGGKNQVAKEYLRFAEQLKVPIIILLDADADAVAQNISAKLRPQDKLLLIQSGEFEDILPLSLIEKAINYKYKNIFQVSAADFSSEFGRVKNLEEIYRINGLGEFKKAEFANDVKAVLDVKSQSQVSVEIRRIIEEIKQI